MSAPTSILWLRQDLRLADNPALCRAAEAGRVIPVYILDDANAGEHAMGGASRWWLHHSLAALDQAMQASLACYRGDPGAVLPRLLAETGATAVYWNRCYEPWRSRRDAGLKSALREAGVEVHSFNASLLWEPWEVAKADGTPYRVFTPFYRKGCANAVGPREPLAAPRSVRWLRPDSAGSVADLHLLPRIRWDRQLEPHWRIGEDGAAGRLETFMREGLAGYREGRDFPARGNVSRLSPHLHFGEVSPHQVWHRANAEPASHDLDHFRSELAWREFSYHLLHHNPELPRQNLQAKFDAFPWLDDPQALDRWQRGQTGYPIVDAGMRQLWQTGYMHNRVRMIVGSFLVKNLLLHWHHGEAWFWDCLVDADLANNSASWQWIAGCGADAAPYFRVFNPVTQGRKFDPDGEYTRRFVPELRAVPDRYLFNPWEAPAAALAKAGVELGANYPHPVVELKASRERALDAFASL